MRARARLESRYRRLAPPTRSLLLALLLSGCVVAPSVLVGLIDHLSPEIRVRPHELPPSHLLMLLEAEQGEDSWGPMSAALTRLRTEPDRPLYPSLFFEEGTKFQYPLSSLLALEALEIGLERLGLDPRADLAGALNASSWLAFVALVLVSAAIFERSRRHVVPAPDPDPDRAIRYALLLAAGLTFYPAMRAYSLGQIQTWINLAFALTLWCWIGDRRSTAGALVGLVCLIKPQFGVLVLWGLLRRQWRFAAVSLLVVGAGTALACHRYGIANNLGYLEVLSHIAKRGETYYPNQSFNGLLNRLLMNGDNLRWAPSSFPPYDVRIHALTFATSASLLAASLLPPADPTRRAHVSDLLVVAVTATLASPVAWEHHYGVLLPIYALVLPVLLSPARARRGPLALLCASYLLTGSYLYAAKKTADVAWLNPLQSYLFAGALMLLLLLYRWRAGKIADPPGAHAQAGGGTAPGLGASRPGTPGPGSISRARQNAPTSMFGQVLSVPGKSRWPQTVAPG